MTDYDLISLFHTSLTLLNQTILDYVSVIFAFLIAGYLIADKLRPSMVVLIVLLFTVIEVGHLMGMSFLIHDMNILTTQIALRVTNGDFSLPNLVMTRKAATSYEIVMGTAILGGYIAALIFFFHQRRTGLKTS